jgi:hypothetical protein
MQNQEKEEIKLPPKWSVVNTENGIEYFDENKKFTLKAAKDTGFTRKFCWAIYNKIEGK